MGGMQSRVLLKAAYISGLTALPASSCRNFRHGWPIESMVIASKASKGRTWASLLLFLFLFLRELTIFLSEVEPSMAFVL